MKPLLQKLTGILLSLAIILACTGRVVEAAAVSEKSVTFSLTSGKYATYVLKLKKGESVVAKASVLSASGTPTDDSQYFGYFETEDGKGSLWYSLKGSQFKKGQTFAESDDYLNGTSYVTFELPEGMKSLKMKVTFYTQSGKNGIKSVKKNNKFRM